MLQDYYQGFFLQLGGYSATRAISMLPAVTDIGYGAAYYDCFVEVEGLESY